MRSRRHLPLLLRSCVIILGSPGYALREWVEGSDNTNLHGHHAPDRLGHWLQNELLCKLRWVTLGYHYDWSKRCYRAGWKSKFPSELAQLSAAFCGAVGLHAVLGSGIKQGC